MTKMIITDLDNTLLRSDKTISEYTIDVLKRCQSNASIQCDIRIGAFSIYEQE
jgi:predicted HAD superfamily phosphohydrolase YqeG